MNTTKLIYFRNTLSHIVATYDLNMGERFKFKKDVISVKYKLRDLRPEFFHLIQEARIIIMVS